MRWLRTLAMEMERPLELELNGDLLCSETEVVPSGGGASMLSTLVLGRAICSRRLLPGVMEACLSGVSLWVDATDLMLLQHALSFCLLD